MGILTTPPLADDKGVPLTGRTGISASVFPGDSTFITPTLVVTGLAQQGNGTVVVDNVAIADGSVYHLGIFEPTATASEAYRGVFRLTATSGAVTERVLEDGVTIRVLEDGTTERILEG